MVVMSRSKGNSVPLPSGSVANACTNHNTVERIIHYADAMADLRANPDNVRKEWEKLTDWQKLVYDDAKPKA